MFSYQSGVTVPEAPVKQISEVRSSSSVRLSWYPPEESNGMIKGYKIEVLDVSKMETHDIKILVRAY